MTTLVRAIAAVGDSPTAPELAACAAALLPTVSGLPVVGSVVGFSLPAQAPAVC